MRRRALLVAVACALAGCSSRGSRSFVAASASSASTTSGSTTPGSTTPGSTTPGAPPSVVLQMGPALPAAARARIEALVRQATSRPVSVVASTVTIGPLASGSLVLGFGDATATRTLIPAADVASLPSEGFLVRSAVNGGVTTVATDGVALTPDPFNLGVNGGLLYGAYALLEETGFAFLHPLAPTIPAELASPVGVDRREAPRWALRGMHIHTQHPLELCEVLNGWGNGDPSDAAGFHAMLDDWDRFLEWAVANRLNRVEWFLLAADSWKSFAEGSVRQARMAELVSHAHAWGIAAGSDAPLALKQQHAWYVIQKQGNLAQEKKQIDDRVDWLVKAGFDFLGTEMGTSEFTSTNDQRMVEWMNEFAAAGARAGRKTYVKAHCSTGQVAKSYPDPVTGGPLNYNFLVRVCDPSLGVYPHTVQLYGLDDPAPTYGNTDFGYMRTFLQQETGRREVVWYPETAYWVNYDINVPLFLPVYGERRLHDLRTIAADENAGRIGLGPNAGMHIAGQMIFSSGWEWGYWLNDVLAARAAWQPFENDPSDDAALEHLLEPVTRVFGAAAPQVRAAIRDVCQAEHDLLVLGKVNGQTPADVKMRNGMAYLEGWDTWGDVATDVEKLPFTHFTATQPEKLGLVTMRHNLLGGPDYASEVAPLLAAMETRFAGQSATFESLRASVPPLAQSLIDDLADAAKMNALRARQVHGLYDYVAGDMSGATGARARLQDARDALDAAQAVSLGREQKYRVPADRIAAWRHNPTCYAFTYLWSARSLHYWWRDEEKAVDAPWSPFVMNVINPADVAIGEGFWIPVLAAARAWGDQHKLGWLVDGLSEPATEPTYPAGGLRQRP